MSEDETTERMSPEDAVRRLDEIAATYSDDPEVAHGEADDVLRAVVPAEVRAAYERVLSACTWWACA